MPPALYLVTTEVAPNAEMDWSPWHRDVHMRDVLKCEGFLSAVRWRDEARAADGWARYLTLYEVESRAALQDYFTGPDAARLRADHEAHFGGVIRLSRAVLVDPERPASPVRRPQAAPPSGGRRRPPPRPSPAPRRPRRKR